MCNKVVNTYLSRIQFVPEYYKALEICAKAVSTCLFVFISVPN